jgi:hypothetical protein
VKFPRQFLFGAILASSLGAQNINVAIGGVATQSAPDSFGFQPGWAIDGSRNGYYGHNSVAGLHNTSGPGGWWQVVLASPGIVNEVVLWNRSDCCGERMSQLRVEVMNGSTVGFSQDLYTHGGYVPLGGELRLKIPGAGVSATAVRITNIGLTAFGDYSFAFAEVEVIRYGLNHETNFARYGSATASHSPTEAARVIDGRTDGLWGNQSCWGSWGSGGMWLHVTVPRHRIDLIRLWPVNTGSGGWPIDNYRVAVWDNGVEVWGQNHLPGPGINNMLPRLATPPSGTDGDGIRITSLFPSSTAIRFEFAEVESVQLTGYLGEQWAFGPGCRGSNQAVPTLGCTVRPVPGANLAMTVTGVPAPGIALLLTGLSNSVYGALPLPFGLGVLGAPGCYLLVSPDISGVGTTATSTLAFSMPLPTTTGTLGATLFQQAALLDPAANAFGFTVSNALEQFIGL